MSLTDHQIAVRLMAIDEGEAVNAWVEKWDRTFPDWGKGEHSGDCTKQCHTCLRCLYEEYMAKVPDVRRLLSI